MKYELKHHAYKPTIGGKSIPNSKMINDLGDNAIHYIGTFSEYNPIGMASIFHPGSTMTAVVVKKTCSIYPQKQFQLEGFHLDEGGGYHSTDFNNNGCMRFRRNDLLRIANSMDEEDSLLIAVPDTFNKEQFDWDIKSICE